MGVDNVNPLEQLQRLDEEIESAAFLAVLRPIHARLNSLARAYADDFDVQIAIGETKQRLLQRGAELKRLENDFSQTSSYLDTSITHTALTHTLGAPPAAPPAAKPKPAPTVPPPAATPPTANVRPAAALPTEQRWNRVIVTLCVAGLAVGLLLVGFLFKDKLKHAVTNKSIAAIQVDIGTTPPGATMRVTGGQQEATCTSNCKISLPPGNYQVSAALEGYEPSASNLALTAGHPASVNLPLQAQAQSVRLLTDLEQGKAVIDEEAPVELQEGQVVFDKLAPGAHKVTVTGKNGSASFTVETGNGRMPAVTGPVSARNMIAVLVSSFGKHARVVTNAGPWKLSVNGQPQPDASPAGADVANFQPGVAEIIVGEGRDQRNMSENFGSAPALTAFLKSDVNTGTLIVSTGQDDVRVFLNNKEYRRRTQRGELRVQTLGHLAIRIEKPGFQEVPAQTVDVKKGAEVRLLFDLKPLPQFGSLQVRGAAAGTEVWLDQKNVGSVGPDGAFTLDTVPPGDRTVELRRPQFTPKRLQRTFQAGHSVLLGGTDVVLAAANGTVKITRSPAAAAVTYRTADDGEAHELRGDQIDLPPGNYVFSATAPGFTGATARVQLAGAEVRPVEFALVRIPVAAPPAPVPAGIADFEDPQAWKQDGDRWVRKGGGFVPYKLPANGTFTFTIELLKGGSLFRAGQARWYVQYLDAKNYVLYELDRKTFWAGVVEKGQRLERVKTPVNLGNVKAFTIQVEVAPEHLITRVKTAEGWKDLDNFVEGGRDFTKGKFGILIQGSEEVSLSDFKFQPK